VLTAQVWVALLQERVLQNVSITTASIGLVLIISGRPVSYRNEPRF
jgi:hypothetical protein